jgi:hypothetical protein
MQITNDNNMSLMMAIWLLHDEYDYQKGDNYVSATGLLKSTKQTILSKRVPPEENTADLTDFLASRFGTAVHDSIEKAWRSGKLPKYMKQLGYPDNIANALVINPEQADFDKNPDLLPVWIEQRAIKEVTLADGSVWRIGGKFDMVIASRLHDTKTTSVYAYIKRSKDDDHAMQGGIYRWLNPDKIEDDHVFIQFVFTDWQRSQAKQNPDYPQHKAVEQAILMPSVVDVETFIKEKVQELSRLWDAPEDKLPECTDKELWRSEPTFRYYSDPLKAKDPNAKSSKNFTDAALANAHLKEKGKGIVITKLGEAKACEYCHAFSVCKQKDAYFV